MAAIFCDPYAWVPEAHRLLRLGGSLVFLGTSTLATLCSPTDGSVPITDQLQRDYFTIHRLDWRDTAEGGGIEFNPPLSAWLRLFRDMGFEVVDFHEIQAPKPAPESTSEVQYFATAEWAHRYPSEQAWGSTDLDQTHARSSPRRRPAANSLLGEVVGVEHVFPWYALIIREQPSTITSSRSNGCSRN